ncbi:hypothetical protein [Legionella brunensis]|uniref:Uncharacterized protein n=1 Tax=Legionella brunensis TaxID=29422 RepID=A0A0W0SP19_9GAMM|nr:hypothetical protein [Legionella brunensis]KTC85104.1 hypothetical protein Lbru_0900 [Legionella brunensis]
MPTIANFNAAPNKTSFLLKEDLDTQFYQQLNALSKKEREELAQNIVAQRDSNFPHLIEKLSRLCFADKGPLFIRGGSADFLGGILFELVRQKELAREESKTFAASFKARPTTLPLNYEFDKEVKAIFSLIKKVAQEYAATQKNENFVKNLWSNLANKIFNPLVLAANDLNLARNMQAVISNTEALNSYFEARLNDPEAYVQAIKEIKARIKEPWDLGGFAFFRGGVTTTLDGQTLRVPHRVAKMVDLIQEYESKTTHTEEETYKLYKDIQEYAQEALDSPRTAQKESTKVFYRALVNDSYLLNRKEVPLNDAARPLA